MSREPFAGPESGPEPPFPIKLSGRIIKGFGRGSKELGIPTANIPITGHDVGGETEIDSGIYYGFAGLSTSTATHDSSDISLPPHPDDEHAELVKRKTNPHAPVTVPENDAVVYPMVMSIGWNPYYKNEVRSVEVHIMHKFDKDFYNALLNLSILAFIRPERDYDSMDALVKDINTDIEVARRSLDRDAYKSYAQDPYLTNFDWIRQSSESSL